MRALQGEVLLSAWERADRAVEPLRAVVLLHVASPGDDMRGLTELPLAERNRRLLELRTLSFGTQMESFAECPQCGAELEFTLDADELAAEMQAAVPLGWSEEGRACVMRPVNTADLLECMRAADEAAAGALLLARSIDGAEWQGEELMEHFEAVNRSAEIRLELRCAECGAASTLDLDHRAVSLYRGACCGAAPARGCGSAGARVWLERARDHAHERDAPRCLPGGAGPMSGVLDRMVARTRGTLPSVQPLVRPQGAAASGLVETMRSARLDVAAASVPSRRQEEPKRVPAARMRALREQESGVRLLPQRSEPAVATVVPPRAEVRSSATQDVQAPEQHEWLDAAQPFDAGQPMETVVRPGPFEEALARSLHVREEQASAIERAVQAELPQDAPVEERTEIRISIGSIELRAPRAEAPKPERRPSTARPKLALADYMRRGRGVQP